MLHKLRNLIPTLALWDEVVARVIKAGFMMLGLMICGVTSRFRVWGYYHVTCFDSRGRIKWKAVAPNLIVNTGLNYILGVSIGATTQITTWYLGLVDNAGFTAFAAGDTHAVHGGWVECTSYSQTNRLTFSPNVPTAQSITNSGSAANFSMNATKTLKGMFLSNDNTKGGTSGSSMLFSAAAFSGGNQSSTTGDTIQATYTLNAASS